MTSERKQVMQDILTTAVEGGCNYWAMFRKIERDADLNVISFQCKDAEDPDAPWEKMTIEKLEKAIEKETKVEGRLRRLALALTFDPENADFDAGDADCFVQLALFEEVVFG